MTSFITNTNIDKFAHIQHRLTLYIVGIHESCKFTIPLKTKRFQV